MADAGLLPAQPAPVVAQVPADAAAATADEPAPTAVAEAAPEAVTSEPELDVTPPAADTPAIDVEAVIAATFSLLRAEPDGSVVIAGSGQPGSNVQLFANGDLLGEAKVEPSGDWVFVPEQPLPPGGLEITLGQNGEPSPTEQTFIVVINEDKTSQPLVVASEPGKISEVLQGLVTTKAAPTAPSTSTIEDTSVTVAMAPEAPAVSAPEAPAASTESPAAQPADATPAVADPAQSTAAPAPDAQEAPAPDAQEAPASTAPEAVAAPEAPSADAAAEATEPAAPTAQPTEVAESEPAATTPAEAPGLVASAPEAAVAVPATIDAIELESTKSFFAGAGTNGATVRLYVDDKHVADSEVADGRWLVEGSDVLKPGSQRVRVDVLKAGTSDVLSRAEVDFVLDVPAEPETVVAAADPAPAAAAPVADASEVRTDVAQSSTPAQQPVARTPSVPAVAVEAPEATAPTEPAVPTMVAVSLGDPNAQRFASGKAIIRRGDNLWTIARRVYGEGLKYTTIYQANTGQIRDPDRIYPGQVFSLPEAN